MLHAKRTDTTSESSASGRLTVDPAANVILPLALLLLFLSIFIQLRSFIPSSDATESNSCICNGGNWLRRIIIIRRVAKRIGRSGSTNGRSEFLIDFVCARSSRLLAFLSGRCDSRPLALYLIEPQISRWPGCWTRSARC